MRQEEVILTTFEVVQTHGFITMMILIWGTAIVFGIPLVYMLNKTSYKSKHSARRR